MCSQLYKLKLTKVQHLKNLKISKKIEIETVVVNGYHVPIRLMQYKCKPIGTREGLTVGLLHVVLMRNTLIFSWHTKMQAASFGPPQ